MSATTDGRRGVLCALERDASTHAGLWLDKYLPSLRPPEGEIGEVRGAAIRALLEGAASTPVPEGYRAALELRRELIESLDGGVEDGVTRLFTAEARGRLVVGLGAHAVHETNIALLHTWGVPFLPGSALKGLASAAAHALSAAPAWKRSPEQGEDHALLFGDQGRTGCVVFHDAWWIPEASDNALPLDLDVMTVHHLGYYRRGESAPADWDEPNPVAFLTARGRYRVALSGPEAWVLRAGEWLEAGLDRLGLGAKTQAGYGRMSLTRLPTQREVADSALREKHKAKLAALGNLPAQHKGAGTARQHIQWLRDAITEGAPAAEVYAIARALYRREPKFWRAWAKDPRRTDDERAFVVASEMLHDDPTRRPQ